MKERIKTLLITGLVITIITSLITGIIPLFSNQQFKIIRISNILFVEFLILLSLSILILFKEQFVFKKPKKKNQDETKQNPNRLNSSLELILVSLPILITSCIILLFI
ncbi:hypothetical protein [Halanaerobacter jeridensis]|uniref:Heme/copper-type cytochrome/quinol oxidase subunit 2 n=1 Tax=Halanaerobacter jeridensis TaxID=706427 RepID=A0A939BPD6_9FIRM|nr:hypothetical protein [Halanaerobacter jeridensis]MBM7556688.1 heme/copper-type cytochrome/quinol oxidase subunit 2 [Halanaerobacter jeridensis]